MWCDDQWFSDYESVYLDEPSSYYFEALEYTELITIPVEKLDQLSDKSHAFEKWRIRMTEHHMVEFLLSEKPDKMNTREEHYRILLADKPELVRRAPLKYLAGLLSIEPETLSRIRSRVAKNKGTSASREER